MEEAMTEIVQFPAIVKGGEIVMMSVDMMSIDPEKLRQIAKTIGGELVWPKVRATYTMPEVKLCNRYQCMSLPLPGKDDCGRHK